MKEINTYPSREKQNRFEKTACTYVRRNAQGVGHSWVVALRRQVLSSIILGTCYRLYFVCFWECRRAVRFVVTIRASVL